MTDKNRYRLVILAAQRARQLHAGVQARIDPKGHKPVEVAIEEVEKDLVKWHRKTDNEQAEGEESKS